MPVERVEDGCHHEVKRLLGEPPLDYDKADGFEKRFDVAAWLDPWKIEGHRDPQRLS